MELSITDWMNIDAAIGGAITRHKDQARKCREIGMTGTANIFDRWAVELESARRTFSELPVDYQRRDVVPTRA